MKLEAVNVIIGAVNQIVEVEADRAEQFEPVERDIEEHGVTFVIGNDQETTVESLKQLAENGEEGKHQEKEIKRILDELEDSKEEIHYLKNELEHNNDVIDKN